MAANKIQKTAAGALQKSPTGLAGLDEITFGGLPKGRPTLITGGSGSGKTLLAMQFLVNGAQLYGENGVYVAFEETAEELTTNFKSLGIDLKALEREKKLIVDHVHVDRGEIEQSGEYDLEGLFVRLNAAIDSLKARRIVLDTIEVLFGGLPDDAILRSEMRRLFRWLKGKGVTAVITGERSGSLAKQNLEEFISDCVIVLDHQVQEDVSTRRLRVMKYRGSRHATNCFPFLIEDDGIAITPITSLGLKHPVANDFVSSGVDRLDTMLDGRGYYRGSSVLLSGTAGSGKTSLVAHFVGAGCARGEKALYAAYEESPEQIVRNMRSIGIDLEPWEKQGRLLFHAVRPSAYGLEMHLARLHRAINEFQPSLFVADPISSLVGIGSRYEVNSMFRRLVDLLKSGGITAVFTALTGEYGIGDAAETGVSSLMDTWLVLRDLEANGERTRGIHVRKSRGMAHSNQMRELVVTGKGIDLTDVYVGPAGVLAGSARLAQEAQERATERERQREVERKRVQLDRKRRQVEARVQSLRAKYEEEVAELEREIQAAQDAERTRGLERVAMARKRKADVIGNGDQQSNEEAGS